MVMAEKLNRFLGPVTVCLPLRGLSAMGSPGELFHDPAADFAFFEALQNNLRDGVLVRKVNTTSEDAPFAELCAQGLLENIGRRNREQRLLREVGFSQGAPDLLLSEAVRMLELRSLQPGESVWQQGAPVDAVCIVNRGALEVIAEGRRLRKLGEGAVFGEAEFLNWDFSAFDLRAVEPCEVFRLRRSVVDQLRRRHPILRDLIEAAKISVRAAIIAAIDSAAGKVG
jgi:CRP-like cAMP-binding protein